MAPKKTQQKNMGKGNSVTRGRTSLPPLTNLFRSFFPSTRSKPLPFELTGNSEDHLTLDTDHKVVDGICFVEYGSLEAMLEDTDAKNYEKLCDSGGGKCWRFRRSEAIVEKQKKEIERLNKELRQMRIASKNAAEETTAAAEHRCLQIKRESEKAVEMAREAERVAEEKSREAFKRERLERILRKNAEATSRTEKDKRIRREEMLERRKEELRMNQERMEWIMKERNAAEKSKEKVQKMAMEERCARKSAQQKLSAMRVFMSQEALIPGELEIIEGKSLISREAERLLVNDGHCSRPQQVRKIAINVGVGKNIPPNNVSVSIGLRDSSCETLVIDDDEDDDPIVVAHVPSPNVDANSGRNSDGSIRKKRRLRDYFGHQVKPGLDWEKNCDSSRWF